jgi:hypothetical protein
MFWPASGGSLLADITKAVFHINCPCGIGNLDPFFSVSLMKPIDEFVP